jgi:hypothetical protein
MPLLKTTPLSNFYDDIYKEKMEIYMTFSSLEEKRTGIISNFFKSSVREVF